MISIRNFWHWAGRNRPDRRLRSQEIDGRFDAGFGFVNLPFDWIGKLYGAQTLESQP